MVVQTHDTVILAECRRKSGGAGRACLSIKITKSTTGGAA